MEEKFLNVEQLAERLNVPISWIYSRTRASGPDAMPKIVLGKYRRFKLDDVMAWIESKNQAESQ